VHAKNGVGLATLELGNGIEFGFSRNHRTKQTILRCTGKNRSLFEGMPAIPDHFEPFKMGHKQDNRLRKRWLKR